MGMTTCYNCQNAVSTEARECPHCGQTLKSRGPFVALGCGAMIVLLVAFCAIGTKGTQQQILEERNDPYGDEIGAYIACMDAIKRQLKAPATAEFPSSAYVKPRALGGGRWQWIAYVDAQNAFGAKIRNDVGCIATKIRGGDYRIDTAFVVPRR